MSRATSYLPCSLHAKYDPDILHNGQSIYGRHRSALQVLPIHNASLCLNNMISLRIDKWLWAARFFKTRTLAADAVDSGKVRINGERIKPAKTAKPGDTLQIDNGATEWEVMVVDLAEVRGSAEQAQRLYRETEESVACRAKMVDERRFFREPGTTLKGRPTKRNRRLIDRSTADTD